MEKEQNGAAAAEGDNSSDVFGMRPDQWQMLAAMKIRRLDREYEEVMRAEIKTDPNKFEGLAKVL